MTESPGGFVGTKLFVVPKGAPTLYRGEWKPAGRKQVIDLDKPGCSAERYADRRHGAPEASEWVIVTWPGTGGYWRRAIQHGGVFVAEWPS